MKTHNKRYILLGILIGGLPYLFVQVKALSTQYIPSHYFSLFKANAQPSLNVEIKEVYTQKTNINLLSESRPQIIASQKESIKD